MQPLVIIGHRGAAGHEPENTLRSVRRALELNVDGIEVDVHLSDGQLIVIHDVCLERTTNGRGNLQDHRFVDLRRLDAGQGERIPILTEVLDEIRGRVLVNVEVKSITAVADTTRTIRSYLQRAPWRHEKFLVSSFDHAATARARSIDDRLRIGLLVEGTPSPAVLEEAVRQQAHSVHLDLESVTSDFVNRAHQSGLRVMVYTVNTSADAERMRAMGVDGVFSDFPDRIRQGPLA
jgi:glycerophosphoryl diester phosphodiesterase